MKRFLLLYSGPPPDDATHEGWPDWLDRMGDAIVDAGSPMRGGFVLRADGSTHDTTTSLHGFGVVEAADPDGVVELLRDHPLWRSGPEYTIEVFEVPRK